MSAYIIRRIIVGVVLLLAMSLVTFLLFFAARSTPRSRAGRMHPPGRARSGRPSVTTSRSPGSDGLPQGPRGGRDYPGDPELRRRKRPSWSRTVRRRASATPKASADGQRSGRSRPGLGLGRAGGLRALDLLRHPPRRHRRGHEGTLTDRGLVAADTGDLCDADVLRRQLPAQVRGPEVAAGAFPEYAHHQRCLGLVDQAVPARPHPGAVLHGRLRPDDPRLRAGVVGEDYMRTAKAKGLARGWCCSSTGCAQR